MDEILSRNQIAFLEKSAKNDFLTGNFYLTGGTALAGFYLKHRYSEDLDFFSEHEFAVLSLSIFLNEIKKELAISIIDYQQSFNRNIYFLSTANKETIKVEFTFFPFPRIEEGIRYEGIAIDSLLDIAVNKLFTIYQRTQARDYIDLYCICKEKAFAIEDLIKKAKIKFDWHIDPLQLGAQFLKVEEVADYPNMIKPLPDDWKMFFAHEAEKFRGEIIS